MHTTDRDPRLVSSGHFVGLHFQDKWWFIQILDTSAVELKPWILLNENGNRAEIAANTTGNQDKIQDNNSDHLIQPNDDERNIINQVLFGVDPSRIQVFPKFSREQNLNLEDSIQPGKDAYWFTGYDSPYNNPSSQSEVFYVNDMSTLKIQAHNPMDEPVEARLSVFVNQLEYATVTDPDTMKAMLQNMTPAKKHPMGLGTPDHDRIKTPSWVEKNFGEHLMSTEAILKKGNASKASQTVSFEEGVNLSG